LPALISHTPQRALIDWDFEPQAPQPIQTNETLKSISIPARFIGRRLQLRELNTRLQSDSYQQLLITGAGGQGKTALASQLLKNQQAQGKQLLVWSAREEFRWDDFIFEAEMLLQQAYTELYNQKVINCTDQACKIKLLLRLLLKQYPNGLVILFDNLESRQDPKTGELFDSPSSQFRQWIEQIQSLKPDKLTLILTSRWKLPDWPAADHLALGHLNYGDYLQLARQSALPQRLAQLQQNPSEQSTDTRQLNLRDIHQALHGNARALEFFSAAISGMA